MQKSTTAQITTTQVQTTKPETDESLVVHLQGEQPPSKKVKWEEGTVDNEFLNKKSSKSKIDFILEGRCGFQPPRNEKSELFS
jgi:hypothetical protein